MDAILQFLIDWGYLGLFIGSFVVYIILLMIGLKIGIAAMSSLQALFEQL